MPRRRLVRVPEFLLISKMLTVKSGLPSPARYINGSRMFNPTRKHSRHIMVIPLFLWFGRRAIFEGKEL